MSKGVCAIGGMILTVEKRSPARETCSITTLFIKSITQIGMGLNADLALRMWQLNGNWLWHGH